VLLTISLSGCLVWETEEARIIPGKRMVMLEVGKIGSDGTEPKQKEEDFSILLHEVVANELLGSPKLKESTRSFVEHDDGIHVKISGVAGDDDALREILGQTFEITLFDGSYYRPIKKNEELLQANGELVKDAAGRRSIKWPADAPVIFYKIMQKGSLLRSAYVPEYSLQKEYAHYKADSTYFDHVYTDLRLRHGRQTLHDRDFKAAYSNYSSVLRVDPSSREAQAELKELAFAPEYELAMMIPLPKVKINIGPSVSTGILSRYNFIDLPAELRQMEQQLAKAKGEKRIHLLCETAYLKQDTRREGDVLALYKRKGENLTLSSDAAMCL